MYSFRLVALVSTYREGTLALNAVRSLHGTVDEIMLWDGPCGEDVCPDAPATEIADRHAANVRQGAWESDAHKRTAMLREAKQRWHDRPLWLLMLDGDELLMQGETLRDLIQHALWQDRARGASLTDPDKPPTGGLPLRIVERDGSVAIEKGRVLNAAAIRAFKVSNLIVETVTGLELRLGRAAEPPLPLQRMLDEIARSTSSDWAPDELAVLHAHLSARFLFPPLPGEPFLLHRSHLRHPARAAHRLHEAERAEVERLGLPL